MTTTKATHTLAEPFDEQTTTWHSLQCLHDWLYYDDGNELAIEDVADHVRDVLAWWNDDRVKAHANAHDDLLAACKFAHSQMSSAGLLCGDIAAAIEKAEAQL